MRSGMRSDPVGASSAAESCCASAPEVSGCWATAAPGPHSCRASWRSRRRCATAAAWRFTASKLPHGEENFERNRPRATRLRQRPAELCSSKRAGPSRPTARSWYRRPHGLGQVMFVGLDLDHPALASWKGRAAACSPGCCKDTSNETARARSTPQRDAPGLRRSDRPAAGGARSVSGVSRSSTSRPSRC